VHARTGTLQISPDRIDDAVGRLREEQIPRYREQQGYKGFTVLADRQSGKVIGISFWESEADVEASDELGAQSRAQVAEAGQASSEPVREVWEVMFDDMV
jgi:heme-degrading monooxygenase HmoA